MLHSKGFIKRTPENLIFIAGLGVVFMILWPGSYYILSKITLTLRDKSPDYRRRVLCILHWFVSFGLSTALYYKYFALKESKMDQFFKIRDEKTFGAFFTEGSELKSEDVAIMNALIYVLFDHIWNVRYGTETALMLLNHLTLFTTAGLYLFRDSNRKIFIEGYTIITVTEPLLHLRFFLKRANRSYKLAECIFIVAFLVIRAGFLTLFANQFVKDETDKVDKALFLANYTIGLLFCLKLIGYLIRMVLSKEPGHILRGVGASPDPDDEQHPPEPPSTS